jgi:tetratricopeptide (TPR) repeat protein
VPLLERALALARSANDATREANVLTRLANAQRQQGRMDDARRHAEQALTLRGASGQADGVALYELGIVQRQTGAMAEALATYERALAIDRELGDGDAEAKVLNSLAIVHAEQGRFDAARASFESALAISRELGDRRQEGLVLGNLGSLNLEQGPPRTGTRAIRSRARDPSRHRRADRGGPGAGQRCPARPGSWPLSRPREAISSHRWPLPAMRANRRQEGVVLGHWPLWKATADSSTRRACTTTRPSPSTAPSAIVAAKAWCSRNWPICRRGWAGDDEARVLLSRPRRICALSTTRLELAELLCLRGRPRARRRRA